VETLVRELLVSPLFADILISRGFRDPALARAHLQTKLSDIEEPQVLKDMERAAQRLARAIRERESIVIYGDYDVDGMSGTALLLNFLTGAGADVSFYIPNRLKEGYSFNPEAIASILSRPRPPQVVITVDHGISAVEGIAQLAAAGVDVIVTDHHEPPAELPSAAHALVNPRQPDCPSRMKNLCGAAVAFKLAWATAVALNGQKRVQEEFREFLIDATCLVAIATIADVMPLEGENRVICRHGLQALSGRKHAGLRALLAVAKLDKEPSISARQVGFQLGPRLNAAGRLGMAELAIELLTTRDDARAHALAVSLDESNERRRAIERDMLAGILEHEDVKNSDGSAGICLGARDWHPGVIGIAAARVADRCRVPVMICALNGEAGRGSARTRGGVDLAQLMHELLPLVVSGGGHKGAAGCTITEEQFPAFRKAFIERSRELLRSAPAEELAVDAEARFAQLGPHLVRELEGLAPHGAGNPIARFLIRNCHVLGPPRRVGRDASTLQFQLREGDQVLRAVAFGQGSRLPELMQGVPLDVVSELAFDDYRGEGEIQLRVVDFRPSAPKNSLSANRS
jgi:single-stranded-DNA-specific exonuclease